MNWTPDRMDRLERAIVEERRVVVSRRGTEYVLIPRAIVSHEGQDALLGLTTTGDELTFVLRDLERFEVVG